MINDIFLGILLSILLGALIGLQREVHQQRKDIKDFAGFRTFTLISLFGYLCSYLSFEIFYNTNFILIGFFGVIILSIVAYNSLSKIYVEKKISATTQISFILTFIIGILINLKLYQFSISIAIIITSILFLGTFLHNFAKKLNDNEIFATLKFAIISLVILPLLPNKNYTLLDFPFISDIIKSQTIISLNLISKLDVFNFYYIWLIVVFISAIAYIGYILMKTIGAQKGILWTGFLGGLISSTALTSSFSIESKSMRHLSNPFIVGTTIACSTMFFRILFEVSIINSNLLGGLIFLLGIMGIVGYIAGIYLFKNTKIDTKKKVNFNSPFTLQPAIKFSFIFLFLIFFTKLFILVLGENSIYILSFLSGISDVDAITISLLNLANNKTISNLSAQIGIGIAAFSNTIFKAGIAYYFGSKEYFKGILFIFSLIIISGLIGMLILIF